MFTFRKSLVRVVTIASLALLFAGPSHAQEKVQLRLNLQKGQTFEQVLAMQQKMSQTFQKQRFDIETQTRFTLHMEVLEKNDDSSVKIKTTYQSASMDVRGGSFGKQVIESHYDSTKPNNKAGSSSQVVAAIIGQSITTTVSPRGEVLKIEGWDKLAQRILDSLKVPAAQRAQMLKAMQSGMKSQTGQSMNLAAFSETPVGIGDSWTTQNSQTTTVPLLLSTRYTLAAIENGVATLNVQSKLSANPDSSAMEVSGSKVKTDFSGTQNGVMRVDESTGLPQNFELHMRAVGRVSINNAKMPKASKTIPMYMKITMRGWTISPPR